MKCPTNESPVSKCFPEQIPFLSLDTFLKILTGPFSLPLCRRPSMKSVASRSPKLMPLVESVSGLL